MTLIFPLINARKIDVKFFNAYIIKARKDTHTHHARAKEKRLREREKREVSLSLSLSLCVCVCVSLSLSLEKVLLSAIKVPSFFVFDGENARSPLLFSFRV